MKKCIIIILLSYKENMKFLDIDKKLKKYSEIKLSKELLKDLREDLIIKWTYNSNAIEGNTIDMYQTKVLLEDGITIGGKTMKEHLEIINHAEAIKYIEEIVSKNIFLSEYEIKNIHNLVTKGIENIDSGKYRDTQVQIGGANFTPVPPYLVKGKMEELILWYKESNLHPIEKSSILHGEFIKIHPFKDGNGRTARLLLNFELMKSGYPPIIINKEEREIYYKTLDMGSVTGNWEDFTEFIAVKADERIEYMNKFKEEEIKINNMK
ncbi:Fic family protein [Sebaldella sp. S0638]|uniref:Fic family protein n=1 Tax=Sebaldella sp. S0638 TaxID=2957809 RepID=UPI00209E02D1|nr:Fic family protein [Sebaldella sp. S0638]MCP1222952.1 Fic family protein [Sebaldella sp. S0638]